MSEDSVVWRAVSTLEWKNKNINKKPAQDSKGFGAILREAQDVVVDKWSNSGSLVPNYVKNRMSEIRTQDEGYIYEQMVKPEEGMLKRGLNKLLSVGKGSKAGKGLRILGAGNSRKVRFQESHAPSASESPNAAAAAGLEVYAAASPVAAKASSPSKGSKGVLKPSGAKLRDRSAACSSDGTSSNFAGSAADLAASAAAIHSAGSSSGFVAPEPQQQSQQQQPQQQEQHLHSRPATGAHAPAAARTASPSVSGAVAAGPGSGSSSQNNSGGGGGDGAGVSGPTHSKSVSCSLEFSPRSLQHTLGAAPTSQLERSNSDGSQADLSANSKTHLADRQLQQLRDKYPAHASNPPSWELPIDPILGYRPLAIPEGVFERWTIAASGSASPAPTTGAGSSRANSRPGSSKSCVSVEEEGDNRRSRTPVSLKPSGPLGEQAGVSRQHGSMPRHGSSDCLAGSSSSSPLPSSSSRQRKAAEIPSRRSSVSNLGPVQSPSPSVQQAASVVSRKPFSRSASSSLEHVPEGNGLLARSSSPVRSSVLTGSSNNSSNTAAGSASRSSSNPRGNSGGSSHPNSAGGSSSSSSKGGPANAAGGGSLAQQKAAMLWSGGSAGTPASSKSSAKALQLPDINNRHGPK